MCSQQVQQTVVSLFSCHVTMLSVALRPHRETHIYIYGLVRPGRDRVLFSE